VLGARANAAFTRVRPGTASIPGPANGRRASGSDRCAGRASLADGSSARTYETDATDAAAPPARTVQSHPVVNAFYVPLAVLLTGCVGFVLPPMKLSGGTGPMAGQVESGAGALELRSATTLRAGFHPLSLMPQAPASAFDAGLGYGGDLVFGQVAPTFRHRTSVHGPYLEGGYYPVRLPAGGATFRLGLRANADLLFQPRGVTGYGGTLVTEFEIGGYAAGGLSDEDDEDDDTAFGTVFGSWSLGGFAGGSARSFPGSSYAGLTAGLSVRVPFIAGVACCVWPGEGSDEASDPGTSSAATTWRLPKRHHQTHPATPVRSSPKPERIPTPKRDELKRERAAMSAPSTLR
jgi:hypothetical protein